VLRGRGGEEPEGRAAAQVACEPTADVSVRGCLCVCARARVLVCVRARLCARVLVCVRARTTAAGLACLHRAHPHLPGDPCAHRPGPQLILMTRIAVPVQWRCRQSKSRKTLLASCPGHQGAVSCCTYPRGVWTLVRERHVARGRGGSGGIVQQSSSSFKASSCVNGFRD
jgi:hypothetical protein